MTIVVTFYLPQFHPIPENNQWWGTGFTEWTSVASARPRFDGHHQPQLPADLGFYDLRLDETRIAQAEMARAYGIDGFCYYHYWFNGRRLLERPFNEVLASGRPDFPFCLCWANENWTRAWDGLERDTLVRQEYSEVDWLAHITWLIEVFKDKRYIKINGKPLFLIYRPDAISGEHIAFWRSVLHEHDSPGLYLCAVKTGFAQVGSKELVKRGYDAVVNFQPNGTDFPSKASTKTMLYEALKRLLPNGLYQKLKHSASANKLISYAGLMENVLRKPVAVTHKEFPCVFASWDNSARRKTATIIQNDDPELYAEWLKASVERVARYPDEERLVFINAWNEWAEGCHLEPDRKYGRRFLEATARAIASAKNHSNPG